MKKLLYVTLLVTLLVAIFTLTTTAATYGDLTYTVSNGEVTITDCSLLATSVTIPSKINGYTVTSIGEFAFEDCKNLTNVIIPDSVTSIGGSAFDNCRSLASIAIPDSVTTIGSSAFTYCIALKNVSFEGNSKLEIIEAFTFWECKNLISIMLPESVTIIGMQAFDGCTKLKDIYLPDGLIRIDTGFDDTAYYNDYSNWTNGALYINNYLIAVRHDVISGNYSIKDGTTVIAHCAFGGCVNLTSITIPQSVKGVGSHAFNGCQNLAEVHITDLAAWCNIDVSSAYETNPLSFANNGLYLNGKKLSGAVAIPEGVSKISRYAFYNCSDITSVTIPSGVTSIGEGAFYGCGNLISVTIPDSVTSIGAEAFYGCGSISKVNITDIKSWCEIDFGSNPLGSEVGLYINNELATDVIIPSSVTKIGNYAFYDYDSLRSVVFEVESKCEIIGNYAFSGCDSLTSITIPKEVKTFGSYALSRCSRLKAVHITDIEAWCNIDFDRDSYGWIQAHPLYNGAGLYLDNGLITELIIPSNITTIGVAFCNCDSLISVTFEEGSKCTTIEDNAFYNCESLTSITIPDSVTSIGSSAFDGCSSLKEVHITDLEAWCNIDFKGIFSNPMWYGEKFYINGEEITNLCIPEKVTVIKPYVFYGFDYIECVEIPETMTAVTANAFSGCSNLKKVIIPSTTTLIAGSAFSSSPDIHGFLGSEAEAFAELKGYTFVPLDDIIYEITYNLSGGEGKFETGKKGVYADYYITSTIPTKLHCTFLGWATEEKGEVVYKSGDVYSANSNLNLYAVWQEPHTIINDITVTPGGNFYVDVVVENCVPVKAITINDIEYSETLTLTSAEWLLTDSILSSVDTNGDLLIAFQNAIDANKAVMRLYFTADSELPDQDAYIRYKAKGTDEENVVFDFVVYDGTVKIRNFIVGDCDGDEVITIDDAIHLAFYTFYSDRYPIPNGMNVDFNKDGEVTIDDAIYLAFYTFYQDRYPLN